MITRVFDTHSGFNRIVVEIQPTKTLSGLKRLLWKYDIGLCYIYFVLRVIEVDSD